MVSEVKGKMSDTKQTDSQVNLKKSTAKMATKQSMTQAIMEAAIMVVTEADNPFNNGRLICAMPIPGSPALKQPTILNWLGWERLRFVQALKRSKRTVEQKQDSLKF